MTEELDPVQGRGIAARMTDGHVSDDPGRPDYTIDGAPGAMLIIISGPSGVGKDTIIDALRQHERATGRDGDRQYVVTVTTRERRPGEVDGVDYHFVSRDEFLRIRDSRGFLEANAVHGNWYGSPRDQVRAALAIGKDAILKIDVQGAQVVKEQVSQALLIFLTPPTLETLFQRLRSRATETADELELRQRNAALELARQGDYDHVVTNETGQVEQTARAIDAIIAEEHRRHAQRRVRV
jgi:guanylate kinase